MAPGGYFGRALVIDVAGADVAHERIELPDPVLRAYVGGVGLGTWLLYRLAPVGVDPLSPEAPLAFVFSPLVGTSLTTSAKFAVVAKSPLTGLLSDALASSRFAIAGKLTGHDAIVLRGRADVLSVLLIDESGVRLEAVPELAERSAADAEAALREQHGSAWSVAAIGPAGERGVRFATISHDGRHAGRGGLGAVLGSKNIKAVLVRAGRKAAVADPDRVLELARDLRERSFGPATRAHRELGTLGNLLAFNAAAALPARNFSAVELPEADRLDGATVQAMRETTRSGCATCTIGCGHIVPRRSGGAGSRLEYQNAVALGPLCGVTDPDDVLAAGARCDDFGMDTISAGATVAWAMECAEKGLIDAPWLRFGDGTAMLRALTAIGHRSPGVGRLLADGSRRAAATVGGDSLSWAPQVKGLELPGYELRTLHAAALGLAVNARGADHNRSGAQQADLDGSVDRFGVGPEHVAAAIEAEDRAAAMDSLILCSFLRGVFEEPYEEWAELLAAVTGWDFDAAELAAVAHRVVTAKRVWNIREGAGPEDDTLPPRMLDNPIQLRSGQVATLASADLAAMVSGYYAARGWDERGVPPATPDLLLDV